MLNVAVKKKKSIKTKTRCSKWFFTPGCTVCNNTYFRWLSFTFMMLMCCVWSVFFDYLLSKESRLMFSGLCFAPGDKNVEKYINNAELPHTRGRKVQLFIKQKQVTDLNRHNRQVKSGQLIYLDAVNQN